MAEVATVLQKADENISASIERLFNLLRIDSISTDPAYAESCIKAARWLSDELESLGFEASVRKTDGHPMVVAHHGGTNEDAPHVLFYGHYDVQPVDPLDLWDQPPFEPTISKGEHGQDIITGRGSSDDKGQLMTFVEACRAYKETHGELPCRITILFEGEEESGSPSLIPFLNANKDELKAEFALVCDTSMWDENTPAISTSLRGLLGEEIIITAADRDLHSGYFGGTAANPIHILSKIFAGIHDDQGRITIKDFYDGVPETPESVKSEWDSFSPTTEEYLGAIGLKNSIGEKGRSLLEQSWSRPTADVNGIIGGYTDEGFKTVIPSQASGKISFRLVGNQNPDAIRKNFRNYVRENLPKDCKVDFIEHGSSPGIQLNHSSPAVTKAKAALSEEWEKPAIGIGMGGSIPIVGDFQSILGMESLLIGFGLAEDRIHSPNEKYNLKSFQKGIRSWIRILDHLAK